MGDGTDVMQDGDLFVFVIDDIDQFLFCLFAIEVLTSSGMPVHLQHCLLIV